MECASTSKLPLELFWSSTGVWVELSTCPTTRTLEWAWGCPHPHPNIVVWVLSCCRSNPRPWGGCEIAPPLPPCGDGGCLYHIWSVGTKILGGSGPGPHNRTFGSVWPPAHRALAVAVGLPRECPCKSQIVHFKVSSSASLKPFFRAVCIQSFFKASLKGLKQL